MWVKSLEPFGPVVSSILAVMLVVAVPGGAGVTGLLEVQVMGLDHDFYQGEARSITIHLTNTDSSERSYEVGLELSDPSWRGSLDRTFVPSMSPGETRPLNLTLLAPPGRPGCGTYVNLTFGIAPIEAANASDLKVLSLWVQEEAEEPYYEILGLPTAVMLGCLFLLALVVRRLSRDRMA